ncbi:DnaD domain-containing protein [Rubrobacter taiwanensis]|jgi:DnaD/phage-associated family protein|nr:DnaD domain protein [Rubrobacter taiwanensis]
MRKIRLTPPAQRGARGARARLYIRWMPHLGAEAVALYELLRVLPDVGLDAPELEELAELLRSTPESVERSLEALKNAGFVAERDGWLEVAEHPPVAAGGSGDSGIEVVQAGAEGVTPDDYFRYMGTLPAPHILEFLNGYCERDGMTPDAVREALRIASERDARRVGYVRSILERWVERGVRTVEDVRRFEEDRRLKLVAEGGKGVSYGENRSAAARRKEGYEWFFGE